MWPFYALRPYLHLDQKLGLDAPRRLALALATCGAQRINLQAQPSGDVCNQCRKEHGGWTV